MALTNQYIQEKLQEKFGDVVSNFEESYNVLSFEATAANNLKVLQFLYDEPSLQFQFLTDICGVNFPDDAGRESRNHPPHLECPSQGAEADQVLAGPWRTSRRGGVSHGCAVRTQD